LLLHGIPIGPTRDLSPEGVCNMTVTRKPFAALTARDLMSRDLVLVRQEMTLHDAAILLARAQVSGAPVVDVAGRCVGVVSSTDFARWAARERPAVPAHLPHTCIYQRTQRAADGSLEVRCTLPPGTCVVQRPGDRAGGTEAVCTMPHAVLADWQVVQSAELPPDTVGERMTRDLATTEPDARVGTLARRMLDGGVHRLVVVDAEEKPVGIVTATDVLAALVRSEAA
jgi:CBS-domain-containing membrane protein